MTRAGTETDREGWLTVIGSMLALIVANGPLTLFSFGLFIDPLEQEFGWSRGEISLASGFAFALSALAVPFVGAWMDRFGIRRVMIPAVAVYALSIAMVGLSGPHVWQFILLYALVGLAGTAQGPIGYVKAISQHFDRNRGLALGIAMAGVGIGAIIVPQFAAFVIDRHGWRMAFLALGLLLLLIATPSLLLLVREPRGSIDRAQTTALPGVGLDAAARSSAFWLIAAITLLVALSINGIIVHMVPIIEEAGLARGEATSLLAVLGAATFVGRLASGFIFDHIFAPRAAAALFLIAAGGVLLLSGGSALPLAVIAVGLCLGGEIDLIGYLTSRYFGLRHFGRLYGVFFAIFSVGGACGPMIMGWSHDATSGYGAALAASVAMLLLAALAALLLDPYAHPVRKSSLLVNNVD